MPITNLDRVYRSKNIRENLLNKEVSMIEEVKNIITDKDNRRVKIEKSDKGLIEHTENSIVVMNEKNQELLKG